MGTNYFICILSLYIVLPVFACHSCGFFNQCIVFVVWRYCVDIFVSSIVHWSGHLSIISIVVIVVIVHVIEIKHIQKSPGISVKEI